MVRPAAPTKRVLAPGEKRNPELAACLAARRPKRRRGRPRKESPQGELGLKCLNVIKAPAQGGEAGDGEPSVAESACPWKKFPSAAGFMVRYGETRLLIDWTRDFRGLQMSTSQTPTGQFPSTRMRRMPRRFLPPPDARERA